MTYELYHHGVIGMKWGVRRFQNKDGSRTPLGKKREAEAKRSSETQPVPDSARSVTSTYKHDDYKTLSNEELRERLNRLNMEQQYKKLVPEQVSLGKRVVDEFVMPVAKELTKDYTKQIMKAVIDPHMQKFKDKQAAKNTKDDGKDEDKNPQDSDKRQKKTEVAGNSFKEQSKSNDVQPKEKKTDWIVPKISTDRAGNQLIDNSYNKAMREARSDLDVIRKSAQAQSEAKYDLDFIRKTAQSQSKSSYGTISDPELLEFIRKKK